MVINKAPRRVTESYLEQYRGPLKFVKHCAAHRPLPFWEIAHNFVARLSFPSGAVSFALSGSQSQELAINIDFSGTDADQARCIIEASAIGFGHLARRDFLRTRYPGERGVFPNFQRSKITAR